MSDVGLALHGPDENSGNVFVIETRARAGTVLESHRHVHGHLSVLVSGRARVTIDGESRTLDGYCMVTVPPGTQHRVEALTDVIWLCLWASDVAPIDQAREVLNLYGAGDRAKIMGG